jgi:subtilase family serine protease
MMNQLSSLIIGLALFAMLVPPAFATERQILSGHVPEAVARLSLRPVGALPATNRLHIAFNLPLRNNDALDKLIRQVYDSRSTNFHRYLTPQQFTARFGPSNEDYQAVMNFANSNHLTVTRPHPGRAIMGIDASVADVERALHVKMLLYQHPVEARTFYAPDAEPSLDLYVPVQAISGLDNYLVRHSPNRGNQARQGVGGAASGTNGNLLGNDFRNAYVPDVQLKGAGQSLGLVEENGSGFVGAGGYYPGDIQLYETLSGITNNPPIVTVFQSNPPGAPGLGNSEFSLDLEMVIAMAPELDAIVLYLPDGVATDEEMYQEMASPTMGEGRPNQISSSWALDVGPACTNYFRELAVQGQSLFIYSADTGAFPVITNYAPGFDYVTVVGGTDLFMSNNGAGWQEERAWSGSSGGYISQISLPFYQEGIDMSLNHGSTQSRNIPDVAMPASGIEIVDSFQPTNGPRQTMQVITNVAGTSAATPLWAAFTALVNEQGAAQGKPPMGFLNPALYAIGKSSIYTNCFHDITVGNNTNTDSPTLFFATNGYDLVTGWGSPKGSNLINALLSLSGPVFVDFNFTGASNLGTFDYPYKTLTQGVSGVSTGGTIFIINGGASSETMTINKPLTLTVEPAAATIGN